MKYEGPKSYQSEDMANVKVFADKQTDAQTNEWAKNYIPPIYQCRGITKTLCQKYGQMGTQLSNLVKNVVGKGDIARYKQFLLFPQCFQKLSVVDESK